MLNVPLLRGHAVNGLVMPAAAGLLGLAAMLNDQGLLGEARGDSLSRLNPLAPRVPHFPTKAKNVIWLFMNGGQSQVDTWDYKPELAKQEGQPIPGFDSKTGFFPDQVGGLMPSPFTFKQYGETGSWASDLFPNLSQHVDKMAFLHSCFSQSNNHSPALFMMNTGVTRMGFPCMGSWLMYGLGSVSQNLPGFVVMSDPLDRGLPKGNSLNWGAGFLPGVYQGTWLRPKGDPIDNLRLPEGVSSDDQRAQLDLLSDLNKMDLSRRPEEGELSARIESFELAFRMQSSAPDAMDLKQESESTHKLYGTDDKRCAHFAKQCLLRSRSSNEVFGSSRSIPVEWKTNEVGTDISTSRGIIGNSRVRRINPWGRCYRISRNVGYSSRRS